MTASGTRTLIDKGRDIRSNESLPKYNKAAPSIAKASMPSRPGSGRPTLGQGLDREVC